MLSRHPIVITKMRVAIGLGKTINGSEIISFSRKVDVLYGLDTVFLNFATEFLVFGFTCFCFHNDQVFCDVLLLT